MLDNESIEIICSACDFTTVAKLLLRRRCGQASFRNGENNEIFLIIKLARLGAVKFPNKAVVNITDKEMPEDAHAKTGYKHTLVGFHITFVA
jgi:hypothetical protein